MSLQRKNWYKRIKGLIPVDKQLDESKLLLEAEKGSLAWIIEQLTTECNSNPNCNLSAEEIAAISAGIVAWLAYMQALGYDMDHLLLQRLARYLKKIFDNMDIKDIEEKLRRMLENPNNVEPILNPDYVPPVQNPNQGPTPDRYHPSYPMHP